MVKILRAFAWMRWRMLVNSLERTGSRDALERFSLALEKLGPILAAVLMVPSAMMLAALGAAAGFSLARGETDAITIQAASYVLLLLPLVVLAGPLLLPGSDRTNAVRLLLLPISRSTLYLAQCASAFGDPWHIVGSPLLVFFAAGLLVGGAPAAAGITFAGALLLIAFLTGLATLVTSGLHLLFRDRRRGELVAMLFIVFIPLASMLPAMLLRDTEDRPLPGWIDTAGRRALLLIPTQLYLTAARSAAAGDYLTSGAHVSALAAMTVVLHGVGLIMFRRVLESPSSSGGRRNVRSRGAWTRRLPGLSGAASAVALVHLRQALRTPRGRSILLSPLVLFAFLVILVYRGEGSVEFGALRFHGGVGLAAATAFFCLMSLVPISMNQFAVDRTGLTMTLLSPLTETELLVGKAVGNALIAGGPALVCLMVTLLLFPGGSPALWIAIPIGLVAVHLVVAPVAAIASATFPKSVELNTIGSNNAHGIAAFTGMLASVVAAVPPGALALLAMKWLDRPVLAPVFVTLWCAVAYGVSRILFILARRIFHARRENLAMLA